MEKRGADSQQSEKTDWTAVPEPQKYPLPLDTTFPSSQYKEDYNEESASFIANQTLPLSLPTRRSRVTKKNRKHAWGNLSYAEIITKAIESTPEQRLTLSQIYDWMIKNIPYFASKSCAGSSSGWKNSVRHNLSLHERFVRVHTTTPTKGSYWTLASLVEPSKRINVKSRRPHTRRRTNQKAFLENSGDNAHQMAIPPRSGIEETGSPTVVADGTNRFHIHTEGHPSTTAQTVQDEIYQQQQHHQSSGFHIPNQQYYQDTQLPMVNQANTDSPYSTSESLLNQENIKHQYFHNNCNHHHHHQQQQQQYQQTACYVQIPPSQTPNGPFFNVPMEQMFHHQMKLLENPYVPTNCQYHLGSTSEIYSNNTRPLLRMPDGELNQHAFRNYLNNQQNHFLMSPAYVYPGYFNIQQARPQNSHLTHLPNWQRPQVSTSDEPSFHETNVFSQHVPHNANFFSFNKFQQAVSNHSISHHQPQFFTSRGAEEEMIAPLKLRPHFDIPQGLHFQQQTTGIANMPSALKFHKFYIDQACPTNFNQQQELSVALENSNLLGSGNENHFPSKHQHTFGGG